MRHMLDTNICFCLIKNHPPQVLQRLQAQMQVSVVMSVVTYAELRAGLALQSTQQEHDEQVLQRLVARIPVLPFTQTDAERFGLLRAPVRDRSRNAMDRLIAAHAVNSESSRSPTTNATSKNTPGSLLKTGR